MALDIKDIEEQRIIRFIHGEMTPDEEIAFNAELQADAELRKKAALMARLSKAMNEVGGEQDKALVDAFRSTDRNTVEKLIRGSKSRYTHSRRWWIAATAAVILLLIGINWGVGRHRLTVLGNEYAQQFEWAGYVRGEMEPYEAELGMIYADVATGKNLDEVINRLQVLYEVSILDEENSYTELSFPIGWYLACAYLQRGERQAAIELLERLQSHGIDKQICADKVKELLKSLSK